MKRYLILTLTITIVPVLALSILANWSPAGAAGEQYTIDSKDPDTFVEFEVGLLGLGRVAGRFYRVEGRLNIDAEEPATSMVFVVIDTTTVSTGNERRDRYLRSEGLLDVTRFPRAVFESASIEVTGEDTAVIRGFLTLHGIRRDIDIKARHITPEDGGKGVGRQRFEGHTSISFKDFGIDFLLRPLLGKVDLHLSIEGFRDE